MHGFTVVFVTRFFYLMIQVTSIVREAGRRLYRYGYNLEQDGCRPHFSSRGKLSFCYFSYGLCRHYRTWVQADDDEKAEEAYWAQYASVHGVYATCALTNTQGTLTSSLQVQRTRHVILPCHQSANYTIPRNQSL